MLTDHTRATAVLEALGIDPDTVLAYGADENGYLVLGRHQDGIILTTADGPEMSRVPWPSRDAWFRFQEATRLDAGAALPHRVQLSRTKGWRKPENTVVVARPGRWGNPITTADVYGQYPSLDDRGIATLVVRDFEVLARRGSLAFPNWRFSSGMRGPVHWTYPSIEEIRAELAGKNLACWCPLDQPCHADVLLAIANGGAS